MRLAEFFAVELRDAEETRQRRGHGERQQRQYHHLRRFLRVVRAVRPRRAKESDQHQPRHIERREHCHAGRQKEQPEAAMPGV